MNRNILKLSLLLDDICSNRSEDSSRFHHMLATFVNHINHQVSRHRTSTLKRRMYRLRASSSQFCDQSLCLFHELFAYYPKNFLLL